MHPYTIVTDERQLAAIAREIEGAEVIGLDLETAKIGGGGGLDPLTGRVRLCSVNTGLGRYVVDLYKTRTMGPLVDAFRRTKGVVVGQNLKFDQKWLLWHYDLELGKLFDTYRASSILYAGLPGMKHDLWSLYKRELGEIATVDDLGGSDWDGTLTQQQLDYAADDIDKLPRLRDALKPKIVQAGLTKIAVLEFNAILPEACMELNGLGFDKEMWLARTAADQIRKDALTASLLLKLPNPSAQHALPGFGQVGFNLDSPDQILKSLRLVGIKQKWKDPDTGLTSIVPLVDTKEMTLAMEADKWPILNEFIEYRGYSQAVKAFGVDYLKHVHELTGRIHSSYFPYTDAGRYANRDPNLQQVPRAFEYRDCFRAAPGRSLAICVAKGTRVATTRGLVAIEQVRDGDCALLEDGSSAPICTLIDRGEQPSLLIRTHLGYELVCTPQHRVRVRDEDGAYVWREAGQIRPSDAVAVQSNRGLPSTNADLPPIVLTNVHEKGLTLPTKATAGFAEFCGYLSGDGSFQRDYVGFVVNAEDADVSATLRAHLARDLQREPPPELSYRGVLDTRIGSLPLLRWCRDNGVSKTQVPFFVWQSAPEVAGAWVRGLFESDGCVSGKSVILRSVSERLLRETQELLLALGILSQRSVTRHGLPGVGFIWNLRIPTDFLPRFASTVGFMSERKKAKLSVLLDSLAASGKSGTVGLPNVKSTLASLQLPPATALLLRNSKHRDKLSSKVAQRLWETDRPTAEHLGVQRMLIDGTFFDFADVESALTQVRVYDLEVPGPHAYVSAGFVSHNCDWSNIEMRIVAEVSKDKTLIKVFQDDRDAHYATASLVTGKPESEIVKAERQQAKPVNFGFIYGMQAARLVMYAKQGYGVSFTEKQASVFRKRFFEAYYGIASWHRFALDSGKRQRETRTLWGRRRILKDEKAHNEFFNSPIQGSGADGLKNAIRIVYERLKKLAGRTPLLGKEACCGPIHMVHDEIVTEHEDDPDLEKQVRQELHDGMIEGIASMMPNVPTRAEVGGGPSWAAK